MHTPHLAATCPVCGTGPYEARDACPLHKAAPKLLEALEGIKSTVTVLPDDSHNGVTPLQLGVVDIGAFWEALPALLEAVAEAKGE